ncbi:hypothetical protein FGG08_006598 [Glutinoglossum americanum]|uniref:Uncharacterized protein n=1 Tax=Glutinoglossum americanum TaxID=1670608 RepID=A0A9P8I4Y0_9PEZI|nr:hypothetical protein FGG08_006598 [Glutinoglossum americanum]
MSTSTSVYKGMWTDYNRSWGEYRLMSNIIDKPLILTGWQQLSTDSVAQFWKTFVAVLLGLSGAYIFAIHKSLLSRFILWFEGDNPECQPLLVHGQEETIRTIIGSPLDNREKAWKLFKYYAKKEDYWRPISGLRPPENHTLTIAFVSSMHIYYLEAGYDPIFPATERYDVKGFRRPYWYNSDPRARVLACVDYTELCSPDGKTCWPMTADLPDGVPNTPAYWLMKWSLETSTIYDSIKWRLGAALLAQEEVSQFRSPKLEADHWEKEVEQLFATSLARIQFSTMGIATGEDRDARAFIEVTPVEARGKLCGIYKFYSIGVAGRGRSWENLFGTTCYVANTQVAQLDIFGGKILISPYGNPGTENRTAMRN